MKPRPPRAALSGTSLLALAAALASGGPAEAGRRAPGRPLGVVVAESEFGHGRVSGAVRRSSTGLEVRLPGGNWVPCGRRCSETLRVQTVDFWEWQSGITDECGILGCLRIEYPRRGGHW